jgi:hypothetical protein
MLVLATVTVWLIALAATGREHTTPATFGLVICLPPAVATMLLVGRVGRQHPELGPAAAMLATGFRMFAAVGSVVAVGGLAESLGTTRARVAEWVTAFYLVTLTIETVLLARRLSDRPPTPPAPDGRPHDRPA